MDEILERLGNTFTDRSRRVVELSIERFDHLGASTFDTTHLLHGLYLEGDGVAFHVLSHFRFTSPPKLEIRLVPQKAEKIEFTVDPEFAIVAHAITFSNRWTPHRHIGTENLLIGVAAAGTKSALSLANLGIVPADLVMELYNLLGQGLASGVD